MVVGAVADLWTVYSSRNSGNSLYCITREMEKEMKTRKEASRGKTVKLHRYWKGIAAMIVDPHARGQYIRMMVDATQSEIEHKNKKRKEKEKSHDE
jgi:hypothetical protein